MFARAANPLGSAVGRLEPATSRSRVGRCTSRSERAVGFAAPIRRETRWWRLCCVGCDAAVPGKCSGLTVSDITKNACRLRWKAPDDDGGSRVTHYVVERQEVGKPYWTTIATFAKVRKCRRALYYRRPFQGFFFSPPLLFGDAPTISTQGNGVHYWGITDLCRTVSVYHQY